MGTAQLIPRGRSPPESKVRPHGVESCMKRTRASGGVLAPKEHRMQRRTLIVRLAVALVCAPGAGREDLTGTKTGRPSGYDARL